MHTDENMLYTHYKWVLSTNDEMIKKKVIRIFGWKNGIFSKKGHWEIRLAKFQHNDFSSPQPKARSPAHAGTEPGKLLQTQRETLKLMSQLFKYSLSTLLSQVNRKSVCLYVCLWLHVCVL